MRAAAELPIADTAEALTPEWLTAALRAGPAGLADDVAVTAIEATPVGTGQMSDSIRLALTYDGPTDAPSSIIAKIPAADPTSRATGLSLRSYEIEVRFYQELAPRLPMRTPHVLHADIEVSTGRFVLLQEDMAPAQQGDQLAGCTLDQASVAVDELVKLHAPFWGDPALDELDWLHRDPEGNRTFMTMFLPNLWDGFRERYRDQLGTEVHAAGDSLFAALGAYLDPGDTPLTVVHGDYRLDNLLFDPTPGGVPIAVVDWQTCTHGAGLQDVSYFIGAGFASAEERASAEEHLVRRYHDGLLAAGVEGYAWDQCWTDYRRLTYGGLIMALAASMLVEQTERGDEMFMAMAHRHSRHVLDLDAPALLA